MAILRKTLRSPQFQGLAAWGLALSQVFCVMGCRQSTGSGGNRYNSTAAGATAGVNLGEIAYQILHHNYTTANETGKVAALENRKDDFVGAINHILPPQTGQNLFPTLLSFLPLVDDGSVEAAAKDMDDMMVDMLADPAALDGMAKLMSSPSSGGASSDGRETYVLISRLLAYPEMESLSRAILDLVRANDGQDDNGNPDPSEKDLVKGLQSLASRQLLGFQPSPGAANNASQTLQRLANGLLTSEPMNAWPDLGAPAWAVRLDVHGNPKVLPDTGGTLPAPFVDADGNGAADVDAEGRAIDNAGNPIDLPAFGNDGARDSYGRALVSGGAFYYEYFDLKRTMLSELLLITGELLQKDIPGKGIHVLAALTDRVQNDNGTPGDTSDDYDTLSPDSPILDLTHANMELVKATPLPDVLKGLAAVIKQNPQQFSDLVDTLLVALKTAGNATSTVPPPAAGTPPALLDAILPMVEGIVAQSNGNQSSMRALLQVFNSEQARLRTLPASFARMMKWSDYGRRIPAGPNAPSVMQRLLTMMTAANGCTVIGASPSSNMAEFYLDAMAGNARILGFNISIGTINQLVDVAIIRRLLCAGITESDVRALKDFNDTGALDAMKPIAKVFSDRGQTRFLKDIMLQLGRNYDATMRPTEPTVVAILESGAVEKLFTVLDQMTRVNVPGTTTPVSDAIADTLTAVLRANPVVDRRGQSHRSLLKLLLAPMDGLSARATQRNVKPELDAVMKDVFEILMATYTDTRGNADPADDVVRWKWECLKTHLAGTLELLADAIPAAAADRSRWAVDQQATIERILTGRDTVFALDMLDTISSSPAKQAINAAIANLVTPRANAAEDAFGGVLILVSGLLVKKQATTPSIDDQALADVLHFAGRQLDPALGRMRGIGQLAWRLLRADDGLFLLRVVRNAFDMGPNGTDTPPAIVLRDVMSEISAAGPQGGPMTADSLKTMLESMHTFMNDTAAGLPHFCAKIKGRAGGAGAANPNGQNP